MFIFNLLKKPKSMTFQSNPLLSSSSAYFASHSSLSISSNPEVSFNFKEDFNKLKKDYQTRYAFFSKWNNHRKFNDEVINSISGYCSQFFNYLKYAKIIEDNLTYVFENKLDNFLEKVQKINELRNRFNFQALKPHFNFFINLCNLFAINFELHNIRNYLINQKEAIRKFEVLNLKLHSLPLNEIKEFSSQLKKERKHLNSIFSSLNKKQKSFYITTLIGFLQLVSIIESKCVSSYSKTASEFLFKKTFKVIISICKEMQKSYTIYSIRRLARRAFFQLQPFLIINKNNFSERNTELKLEWKNLVKELKELKTIEQVYKQFDKMELAHLKDKYASFEKWKFSTEKKFFWANLKSTYFSCRYKQVDIQKLSKDRKKQRILFDQQVKSATDEIVKKIDQQSDKSWDEIRNYFLSLHIKIDQEAFDHPLLKMQNISIQSSSQWNLDVWKLACKQPHFQKKLAIQQVTYHHCLGQLLMQALLPAVHSKIEIERTLSHIYLIEVLIKLTSYLVDFYFSKVHLTFALSQIIKFLVKEDKIAELKLFLLFFPSMDLSFKGLLIEFFTHCFSYSYKRHEYSLKGYSFSFQKRLVELHLFIYPFISILKKISLYCYFKFSLISFCHSNFNYLEKKRELENKIKATRQKHEQKKSALEADLTQLIKKDIEAHAYLKHKGQPPLATVEEVLNEACFHYFPLNVQQFFKECFKVEIDYSALDPIQNTSHFNSQLNEKVKFSIQEFFELKKEKFFGSYYS